MSFIGEFHWPIRVYYEDTDAGGVVYYANYLKFMERGRSEMLRQRGWELDRLEQEEGILFAVSRVTVEYRQPARFNDALIVSSQITRVARASIDFKQAIHRSQSGELLCDGQVRVACVSAAQVKPCPIPKHIRETILER